jgi:hypothetical protein
MREKKQAARVSEVVQVVELTQPEVESLWDGSPYVPPTDDDVFVRCQKIVIAYCTYYAPTVGKATYTRDYAYRQARRIARPLAALAARIPLTQEELFEHAYQIFDAIASWAAADDRAAHAIARVFQAYGLPMEKAD